MKSPIFDSHWYIIVLLYPANFLKNIFIDMFKYTFSIKNFSMIRVKNVKIFTLTI